MTPIYPLAARSRINMYLLVSVATTIAFLAAFSGFNEKLFSGTLVRLDFVYVHAGIVAAWCLLFIGQVTLVRMGKIAIHRKVGLLGIVLTVILVVDGIYTSILGAQLGGPHSFAPTPIFLAFLFILAFEVAILAGLGLALRKRVNIHKRLMLSTFIVMIPVALVRLPLGPFAGPLGALAVTDISLLAVALYDTIRHRRFHPAFYLALVFLLVMQVITFALIASPQWEQLLKRLKIIA